MAEENSPSSKRAPEHRRDLSQTKGEEILSGVRVRLVMQRPDWPVC